MLIIDHVSHVESAFRIFDLQEFIQPKRLASSLFWAFLNWVHLYLYLYRLDYVVFVFELTEREMWELRGGIFVSGLDKVQEVLGGYHYPSPLLRNTDSSLTQEHIPGKCYQLLQLFDLNGIESLLQKKTKNLKLSVPVWISSIPEPDSAISHQTGLCAWDIP